MPSTGLNLYVIDPTAGDEMRQYNIREEEIAAAVIAITGQSPHLGCSAGQSGLYYHEDLVISMAYDPSLQPPYTVLGCYRKK